MKRCVGRKDLTWRHVNVDEWRSDPGRSTKDNDRKESYKIRRRNTFTHALHDARRTIGTRTLGRENRIPSSDESPPSHHPVQDTTLTKLKETHYGPMDLRPLETRRTGGDNGRWRNPKLLWRGGSRYMWRLQLTCAISCPIYLFWFSMFTVYAPLTGLFYYLIIFYFCSCFGKDGSYLSVSEIKKSERNTQGLAFKHKTSYTWSSRRRHYYKRTFVCFEIGCIL